MKNSTTYLLSLLTLSIGVSLGQADAQDYDPTAEIVKDLAKLKVGAKDWPQWGGWSGKNNTPDGKNIPIDWNIDDGTNIKWSAKLGSQTYGNPAIANGKVYVGTNNGAGHLKRYPSNVDLGCLLCFDEKTGEFLWQHSSPKLSTGRVHDWPLQGVCCSPVIDGERLWFVTSRGEVRCLDTEGFRDNENDGSYTAEPNENKDEADVIWVYDMMGKLQVSQHNMCSCSVAMVGDILLINTSNGLDESHINLPSPNAASFIALDRNTGELLWSDKSPGANILHGQWSSPTTGEFNGQMQVIFAGGDGWVYSFDPKGDGDGNAKLLWKLDGNPKRSKWILGGRGTRNNIIATPVVYDGMVYVAVGQDPEHGEGVGHVWCIDPNKRGDVSPTQVFNRKTQERVSHRRLQAYEKWEDAFDDALTKVDEDEFKDLVSKLEAGDIPAKLKTSFQKNGIPVGNDPQVSKGDDGFTPAAWTIKSGEPGDPVENLILLRHDRQNKTVEVNVSRTTGEVEKQNPNSAVVWHYTKVDTDGNGKFSFEETMHRTIGTAAIKNDLLFISDFSGLFHCIDAKKIDDSTTNDDGTHPPVIYWKYDMFAAAWGSPLIVDGKVYIGDEDGDIAIFMLSSDPEVAMPDEEPIAEVNVGNAVYSSPIVANNVLYIANKSTLYAISSEETAAAD